MERRRYAGGSHGGASSSADELLWTEANLAHKISQQMVDCGGVATTTEYSGGALASLHTVQELTEHLQRARVDAVSCWGGGGVLRW